MLRLAKLARRFKDDESGAAMVEYAVIMAIVIGIVAATWTNIGVSLANVFTSVQNVLTEVETTSNQN